MSERGGVSMTPEAPSRNPQTDQPEATTEAGQTMESWLREPEDYEWGRQVTNAILAIEAEAAQRVVERLQHIDSAFTVFLTMQKKFHPTGGPAPSWIDFIRDRAAEVRAILDEVAAIGDSAGEEEGQP